MLAGGLPEELAEPKHFLTLNQLNKDMRAASLLLSRDQVRWLVDHYYQVQRSRLAAKANRKQPANSMNPLSAWSSWQAYM